MQTYQVQRTTRKEDKLIKIDDSKNSFIKLIDSFLEGMLKAPVKKEQPLNKDTTR